MATVLHKNTFTDLKRGQLLAAWEGELIPGDLVSFVDSEVVPGYSLHLHVAEEAFATENMLAGSLDGHQVLVEIQKLKLDYPVDRWCGRSRFMLSYASVLDVESMLEFWVSLVIDGTSWLDYNLGMKRSDFQGWLDYDGGRLKPERDGPFMSSGPWARLEWWVQKRPIQIT